MSQRINKLKTWSAAILLGMTAAIPAQADDTEIYTGLNSAANGAVDPNVLFILDTSGSMGSSVTQVIAAYDPTTTYTGSCVNSRVYYSTSGTPPTCGTSRYFDLSKFRCAAANTPLFGTGSNSPGFFQDRVARHSTGGSFFSSTGWKSLSTFDRSPNHVECRSDENIHGSENYNQPDGSGGNYIRNTTAGYTSNASRRRNWNNTGQFYTLYSANYMNYFNNSASVTNTTRLEIMKDVVKSVADSNNNLNIGLMRFDTDGGPVIFPFSDIDAPNVRTNFKNTVSNLNASGITPLSETLREASRVYRGENAVSGLGQSPNSIPSVAASFISGTTRYDTPLDVQCQKNFIILLTDGEPVSDDDFDANINNLISGADLPSNDTSCGGSDNCLDELAEFLNEVDQVTSLNGKQNVVTYTIGFFSNQTLLANTANKGGGSYFLADNFAALSSAFTQIITEIQAVNTTFTAPAVSVNAFNRVTNRKELFFTLFKPEASPVWTGNLKRYELDFLLDSNGDPIDTNNDGVPDDPQVLDDRSPQQLAVDPQTGFFDPLARSFWTLDTDAPDGDETSLGGAARVFGGNSSAGLSSDAPALRTVYTYTGTNRTLSAAVNAVQPHSSICSTCSSNPALTSAFMGHSGGTTPSLQDLINWRAGVDVQDEDTDGVSTDARRSMADPLHTKPVLVTYGATDADPDITLFMATNDGSLHAIDVDDGTEVFTFIPPEEMLETETNFNNIPTGEKEYGLDGNITLFHQDINGDGILNGSDKYILIVGQRRGGTRYYALDITDRANPVYLWSVLGGQGGAIPNTSGEINYIRELGQTWSTPKVGRVSINSSSTDVLIFGGGYDTDQDVEGTARTTDDSGRGIFMVNVYNGNLVWSAGPPPSLPGDPDPDLDLAQMAYSIPADVRVIDINADGFTDRIYAADTGGQVWRFDISSNATSVADLVDGTVLADIQRSTPSSTATVASNRKFFYAPDPSLVIPEDDAPYIALAIGSGNRSHPLNQDVQDRFYMIKDPHPFAKPAAYPTTLYESDLLDTTTDLTPDVSNHDGWYIQLADGTGSSAGNFVGEKVLSESVTFDGTVLFTTFVPVQTASAVDCAPNQGTGAVYAVNIEDARPVQDLDTTTASNSLTRADRRLELTRTGIAPEVTILFPPLENVDPQAIVAAEKLDGIQLDTAPNKTYWFMNEEK